MLRRRWFDVLQDESDGFDPFEDPLPDWSDGGGSDPDTP